MRQLRAANRLLTQELKILKKLPPFFEHPADLISYYPFIDQQRSYYPVRLLCRVVPVALARYYGNAYRALLAEHGCLRSQNRQAERMDNTQAESLWARLETEQLLF